MGCASSQPQKLQNGAPGTPGHLSPQVQDVSSGKSTPVEPVQLSSTEDVAPTGGQGSTEAAADDESAGDYDKGDDTLVATSVILEVADPKTTQEPAVDWQSIDWSTKLSKEEYQVLREKKTEKEGSGEYYRFQPPDGYFKCRGCSNPLFSAAAKYSSGCGWPAFDRCYKGGVTLVADVSHGMARREICCAQCGGHLGHLFVGEGDTETNQRHCVNSLSIKFVKGAPPAACVENGEQSLDTTEVDRQLIAKGGATPQVRTASVIPASDLDLTDPQLKADWEATRALERGWCLCSYAPSSKVKIVPTARGDGGFDELRVALADRLDAVSYAILPATVDGRLRHVFLCFIGEATPAIKKGRAALHAPHMEKFYHGTVGAFPAITSSEELETGHLNKLLAQLCKGCKDAAVR